MTVYYEFLAFIALTSLFILLVFFYDSLFALQPVLILYKIGGFIGFDLRLEIFCDDSYVLYNHNEVRRKGKLNIEQIESMKYLIDNFPALYTDKKNEPIFDGLYHVIKISDKEISICDIKDKAIQKSVQVRYDKFTRLM